MKGLTLVRAAHVVGVQPPGSTEHQALRDRIAALEGGLAEWRWCNFPRHESTN